MDADRELTLEVAAGSARYLFRKEHDLRVAAEARVAELEHERDELARDVCARLEEIAELQAALKGKDADV